MITHIRNVYHHMLHRCNNPNDKSYPRYGGRGIKVCDRWMIFENFKNDMGERPSNDHQLDRINNDGNYEPGNCRWATRKQQSRNRSNNIIFDYNGVKASAPEIAELSGVKLKTIYNRLRKGMSIEVAASTDRKLNERIVEFGGLSMSISAWSKKTGINKNTLAMRFTNGWSVERALTTKSRGLRTRDRRLASPRQ